MLFSVHPGVFCKEPFGFVDFPAHSTGLFSAPDVLPSFGIIRNLSMPQRHLLAMLFRPNYCVRTLHGCRPEILKYEILGLLEILLDKQWL